MKKLTLAAVVLMAFAMTAGATSLCTVGTNDVLSLNPGGCTLDGLLFSNFSVSDNNPLVTYVVGINGTFSGGPDNDLRFTVSPAIGSTDIILAYKVSGGLTGADVQLGNYYGPVSITETVCDTETVNAICPEGHIIGHLAAFPGHDSQQVEFALTNPVWIMKDINIPGGATMSDFQNSHAGGVPEPISLVLIGSGLLGLGLLRRRVRS